MPYGDFDTMLGGVVAQLAAGPWLLGERFTACDVLWGSALTWTTGFGIVPRLPPIQAYIERFNARPAVAKVRALDESLAARKSAEQAQ
jgi:glutathione S-transferase